MANEINIQLDSFLETELTTVSGDNVTFVIVDEAQNVTHTQMQAVIGRLGKNSKMVICGDIAQIDLKDKRTSGFSFLNRLEENVEGFRVFTLIENHRHEIVSPILSVYELYRE